MRDWRDHESDESYESMRVTRTAVADSTPHRSPAFASFVRFVRFVVHPPNVVYRPVLSDRRSVVLLRIEHVVVGGERFEFVERFADVER